MATRSTRHILSRRWLSAMIALVVAALLGISVSAGATATTGPAQQGHPASPGGATARPTIVFVHGAFADSSGWNSVAGRLIEDGYPVLAFSNSLRGPIADAAYLRDFLSTIPGPVVLVGHSYGGAVITNAATGNPNVKALVYVAAYALAEGESVAQANDLGGGHTDVTNHLVVRPFPGASSGDADASIDPAWFPRLFAPDLPRDTAQVMAATQRPAALAALVTPSGSPAWKTIPSWYLVANQDRIIPPEAERVMAQRAHATTVQIDSSHVAMMSHPGVVTRLIRAAANG